MDPNQNPKLKEAMAKEGILGKQRPGAFHIYQKRYCKFIDGGLTFAYADSKEDYNRGKINGQIPLKDVLEIVAEEKPKKFQLILEGRVFKFEASSIEEKRKWVEAVQICKDYADTYEQRSQEQMLAIDSDIRFEETSAQDEEAVARRGSRFNPLGVIASTAKKVLVDTAIKTGVGVVRAGVNTVGSAINNSKPRSNEEFLKAKKLDVALDSIDKKILQSRIMMGIYPKLLLSIERK